MKRRSLALTMVGVLTVGMVSGGYLWVGRERGEVVVETLRTTAVYTADVEAVMTFDATVGKVFRTDPGVTSLSVIVPVEPLVLFDLVPALDAGEVDTKASINGRKGSFKCASLAVLDSSLPAAGGSASVVPEQSTGAQSEPTEGGEVPGDTESQSVPAQSPQLRCTVPADVQAYAGVDVSVELSYRTAKGARRTLQLEAPIVSEVTPGGQAYDHLAASAEVEPELLYRLAPALSAGQVTARALVVGRDDQFDCLEVSLDDPASTAEPTQPRQGSSLSSTPAEESSGPVHIVSCRVPDDVETYAGVGVKLQVSLARSPASLVVPLSAVRLSGTDKGIVSVVTGVAPDGTETTESRVVDLGLDNGLVVAITGGLAEGDLVVDPITQQ